MAYRSAIFEGTVALLPQLSSPNWRKVRRSGLSRGMYPAAVAVLCRDGCRENFLRRHRSSTHVLLYCRLRSLGRVERYPPGRCIVAACLGTKKFSGGGRGFCNGGLSSQPVDDRGSRGTHRPRECEKQCSALAMDPTKSKIYPCRHRLGGFGQGVLPMGLGLAGHNQETVVFQGK